MDKDIRAHWEQTQAKIAEFEKQDKLDWTKLKQLYNYHIDRVRDFQHERLIHLLVTFFFGGVLLLAIISLFAIQSFNSTRLILMNIMLAVVILILFVTELFYIRHYYKLENGTQNLYILTVALEKLLEK